VCSPEQFALAGHSMGGRVAQAIYRRAPQRVPKLALLATDYRGPADDRARLAELEQRDAMLARAAKLGMADFAKGWAREIVSPSRSNDQPLIDAVSAMAGRQTQAQFVAQSWAGLTRPDFADLLPAITCPTLLIAGGDDGLRPASVHREMDKLIPRSELLVLARCGHMVTMEQPDAVATAMRRWLLQ
jgi:pimeloyl-ACP methyl ester carboxylesterase